MPEPRKLHLGSGAQRLDGWLNVDLQPLPEVDRVHDVTTGLPFTDVEWIFAEHFLEHLGVSDALAFLDAAHAALVAEGWIRLSTPNLDWVWEHVYRPEDGDEGARRRGAIRANRAFYGWRHRFLWNRPLLERAMVGTGFVDLRWCRYGESEHEALRGLERHERYEDTEALPHVLIVEGRKGRPAREVLEDLREELEENFLRFLND